MATTEKEGGSTSGVVSRRGVLEILPKEIWEIVAKKVEDPTDWLNFIRVSPHLENLMGTDYKVIKLFPEVFKLLFQKKKLLKSDVFNLRIVNKKMKAAVDAVLIAESRGYGWCHQIPNVITHIPKVLLNTATKVQDFKTSLKGSSSSRHGVIFIPFEIRFGMCFCMHHYYADRITTVDYWRAVEQMVNKLGRRIIAVVLDVHANPQLEMRHAREVVKIVINILRKLPNMEYLLFSVRTPLVEQAIAEYYNERETAKHRFPAMNKLKTLHLATGGGHNYLINKLIDSYPECFLRRHGVTLKELMMFGSEHKWKTMDPLTWLPSIERLLFDQTHCTCCFPLLKNPDVIEALPKLKLPIEFGTDGNDTTTQSSLSSALKEISVYIDWEWLRPNDVRHLFHWLSKNYSGLTLDALAIKSHNSYIVFDYYAEEGYFNSGVHQAGGEGMYPTDEIDDFSWLRALQLPKIKKISLTCEYKGSWSFLTAFRDDLESLQLYYRAHPMESYEDTTLLARMFGNEEVMGTLIWDYFPKLRKLQLYNHFCGNNCYTSTRADFIELQQKKDEPKQQLSRFFEETSMEGGSWPCYVQ